MANEPCENVLNCALRLPSLTFALRRSFQGERVPFEKRPETVARLLVFSSFTFALCFLTFAFCPRSSNLQGSRMICLCRRFVLAIFALCFLPLAFCLRSSFGVGWAPASGDRDDAARAVVQLLAVGPGAGDKNRECSATGFLINAAGYILTNAHVVEEARHCLAGSAEGKIVAKFAGSDSQAEAVSCDLVGTDEAHDLAVLKLERPPAGEGGAKFAALDARDVGEGTRIAVTGHSASTWLPTTERGRVIRHAALALDESSAEATSRQKRATGRTRSETISPVRTRSARLKRKSGKIPITIKSDSDAAKYSTASLGCQPAALPRARKNPSSTWACTSRKKKFTATPVKLASR